MKISQNVVDRIYKSTAPIPTLNLKNTELVFPFDVKTGFVNATEDGLTFDSNVTNYARFERIFTGFEAVSIIWQDSTYLEETEDLNHIKHFTKRYRIGNSKRWMFNEEEFANEFSSYVANNDFESQKIIVSATMFSDTRVSEQDLLRLYVIPNKYGNTIFYIESVEEWFEPNDKDKFKLAQVNLRSLNDRLAQTGLALNQYVQFATPGEGYAFPSLIKIPSNYERQELINSGNAFNDLASVPESAKVSNKVLINDYLANGECIIEFDALKNSKIISSTKGYILDDAKLVNKPVTSIQLELLTPNMLSSVYAYGRPLESGSSQGQNIAIPRPLIPYEMLSPVTSQQDFSKPYKANTDYVWIHNSKMEIETYWKDWNDKMYGEKNPDMTKKWYGYLRVKTGDHIYDMNAHWYNWLIGPFLAWATGSMEVKKNADGYVEAQPGTREIATNLALGGFLHKAVPRLPLDYKESVTWTVKDIPIVGGLLSKATLGLPISWKQQTDIGGKNYNIPGLMSRSLYDFISKTYIGEKHDNSEYYTGIPLDTFSKSQQEQVVSKSEFATIVRFSITDKFSEKSTDFNSAPATNDANAQREQIANLQPRTASGATYNTIDLGYNKDVLFSADSKALATTSSGFALDLFGFHTLMEGDYKITCFSGDDIVFTGSYKTLSTLTGSIRDWNNTIKMSHWNGQTNDVIDSRSPLPDPDFKLPSTISDNGLGNGRLVPRFAKNQDGTIKRDNFGNPVYEYDNKTGDVLYDSTGENVYNTPLAQGQTTRQQTRMLNKLILYEPLASTTEDKNGPFKGFTPGINAPTSGYNYGSDYWMSVQAANGLKIHNVQLGNNYPLYTVHKIGTRTETFDIKSLMPQAQWQAFLDGGYKYVKTVIEPLISTVINPVNRAYTNSLANVLKSDNATYDPMSTPLAILQPYSIYKNGSIFSKINYTGDKQQSSSPSIFQDPNNGHIQTSDNGKFATFPNQDITVGWINPKSNIINDTNTRTLAATTQNSVYNGYNGPFGHILDPYNNNEPVNDVHAVDSIFKNNEFAVGVDKEFTGTINNDLSLTFTPYKSTAQFIMASPTEMTNPTLYQHPTLLSEHTEETKWELLSNGQIECKLFCTYEATGTFYNYINKDSKNAQVTLPEPIGNANRPANMTSFINATSDFRGNPSAWNTWPGTMVQDFTKTWPAFGAYANSRAQNKIANIIGYNIKALVFSKDPF